MDAHERKAWYQSERERLKFEQETAQLIPASDVRREFAIWAKAVVQVLGHYRIFWNVTAACSLPL